MMSPQHEEVEVAGASIPIVFDRFRRFTPLANEILRCEGMARPDEDGFGVHFNRDAWYPLPIYLKALERVSKQIGDAGLFEGWLEVTSHAQLPNEVRDVHAALEALDAAYLLNHRRNGQCLFDATTGKCEDVIGHLRAHRIDGRKAEIHSNTPYPCAYDRGLIASVVRRFHGNANVICDPARTCRKQHQAGSCAYLVTWA